MPVALPSCLKAFLVYFAAFFRRLLSRALTLYLYVTVWHGFPPDDPVRSLCDLVAARCGADGLHPQQEHRCS